MSSPIDQIRRYHAELTDIRQDIHAHPELGLEEHRTADLVARKLEEWGIEVHRGVGITGVVGVLRSGNGEATIGLRADMDALPIAGSERPALPQPRTPARCTPAAMTGTPPCCSAPRAIWPRRATSTAPSTSSSSPARKASAARWRC